MSEIAAIRRKIGDKVKAQRDIVMGNSGERTIHLQYESVFEVIVQIDYVEKTEGVDYSVDYQAGRIVFQNPPVEGERVTVDYLYAAYSNEELQGLIDETGSVNGAVIACLEELTMETARFYDFTQGETSEKKSQVFKNLMALLDSYRAKETADNETKSKGSGVSVGKRTVARPRVRPSYPDITQSPSRRY